MSDVVGLWIYFIGCALVMVVGITLATLDRRADPRGFEQARDLDTWATATILSAICWPGLFILALFFCVGAGVAWLGFHGFGLLLTITDKLVLTPLAERKKGSSDE